MSRTYRQVEKEEFEEFVRAYPNPLRWEVSETHAAPVGSYIDSARGKWPNNIIAKVKIVDGCSGEDLKQYFILENEVQP